MENGIYGVKERGNMTNDERVHTTCSQRPSVVTDLVFAFMPFAWCVDLLELLEQTAMTWSLKTTEKCSLPGPEVRARRPRIGRNSLPLMLPGKKPPFPYPASGISVFLGCGSVNSNLCSAQQPSTRVSVSFYFIKTPGPGLGLKSAPTSGSYALSVNFTTLSLFKVCLVSAINVYALL